MPSQTWFLDGGCARLELPGLTGRIDSARPGDGLTALVVQGVSLADTRLLGVSCMALAAAAKRVDWHVRADELVAGYEIGQPDAAHIDISWHATGPSENDTWLACIDLLVSVRTERLDWRHDVSIEGDMTATDAWQEPSRAGCLLVRSERWIYAEFVHPADLRRDEVSTVGNGATLTRARRHLFPPDSLEKGVILRARARGLFLSPNAPTTIEACYKDFIAADPPLGS